MAAQLGHREGTDEDAISKTTGFAFKNGLYGCLKVGFDEMQGCERMRGCL
jgi:hypothetical protein